MEKTIEEKIQEFKDRIKDFDCSFKRVDGWFEYHLWNCRYFTIELIPSLTFFIDAQMNETFKTEEGNLIESYVGIGLAFNWLGLNIGGQINFKTNKPLENE